MKKVQSTDKVKVHYTGKLENGEVFDSSKDKDPLQFEVGAGQVISGFDNAVVGMGLNETKSITLSVEEGYGPVNDNLIQEIPRTALSPDIEPKVGMQLVSSKEDGESFTVMINEVKDETIVIDANHPLAGKPLVFDIEVVGIG